MGVALVDNNIRREKTAANRCQTYTVSPDYWDGIGPTGDSAAADAVVASYSSLNHLQSI